MIKLCAFADESASSIEGQIEALKRNNIDYLELRGVDGKNVSKLTDEEALAIYDKLNASDVKVWSIGSPLGKVDIECDFEEYKNTARRICKIAKIFHTDRIRMFSFFHAYEKSEKVHKYLKEFTDIAKEENVTMYHENEKDIYGDVLKRVVEILDRNSELHSVYDPANYIQTGEYADDTLNALVDRTDYFHIKDVIRSTGELVPAGYGDGKIDKLIEMIGKRDVVLSVEPHLAIFKGFAQIDKTEMKNKFTFSSNEEAFDAAVNSLKKVLNEAGYKEENKVFVK
ncbi:MAG: sugar phosphate isomerase/epimerase [Candidatus Borkfalkiaceae bacterium]|nr:sugar phosphate isomerase/epimerase [Christensenellaceae bacterium]